jgi:hypothetical protein
MINRYNYEEYFLLYVDKELSSEDRVAVEDFVLLNPDLEEELNVLKQSVLRPDEHIVYPGIDGLFKAEIGGRTLNPENYQEYFLLYHDGELDGSDKKKVEEFLALHPGLEKEFKLLLQARFAADPSVVFPDKNILYRKVRKPIPLLWALSAAAIAFLLVTGFLFYDRHDLFSPGAGAQNGTDQASGNIKADNVKGQRHPRQASGIAFSKDSLSNRAGASLNGLVLNSIHKPIRNSTPPKKTSGKPDHLQGIDPDNKPISPQEPVSGDSSLVSESAIALKISTVVKTTDQAILKPILHDQPKGLAPDKLIVFVDDRSNYLTNTAYVDDNNSLASDDEDRPERKNRLRGIFRTVSRVVNKTANADQTGNRRSVTIGSFQIALK